MAGESPQPPAPTTSWVGVSTELERSGDESGCWLTLSQTLALTPDGKPAVSSRNGQGPRGWSNHWLIVPSMTEHSVSIGMVILDDPVDRPIPSLEHQ